MKVELERIILGHSEITDSVFAGIPNKSGNMWLKKHDVTNHFIDCVIKRWEGQKEIITAGNDSWEISVKKIKPTQQ